MSKKIISISICALLIITAICIPVSSYQSFLEQKNNLTEDISPETKIDKEKSVYISNSFNKIVDKLCMNKNIQKDLKQLYFYPEIKESMQILSNDETTEFMDLFFSMEKPFQIRKEAYQLAKKIDKKLEEEPYKNCEIYLNSFFSDIKRIEDLRGSDYLSESNVDIDKIYEWYSEWKTYSNKQSIFDSLNEKVKMDNETIFLILFAIWVFINGALAIGFPEFYPLGVMIIESLFFGLIGSLITVSIFTRESHPLLEGINNFINNSIILSKMPQLQSVLLSVVNAYIDMLNSRNVFIISVFGWIISNIAFIAFSLMFYNVMIVKLISCGIWFIMPLIIWMILKIIVNLSEHPGISISNKKC